jgi:hypothetical protein
MMSRHELPPIISNIITLKKIVTYTVTRKPNRTHADII